MKILNKTKSELSKFIEESLNSKAFNMLTFLESTQDLVQAIGASKTDKIISGKQPATVSKLHDKVFGVGNQHIEIPLHDPVPDSVKSHVESQGDSITENNTVKLKSGREVELSKYLPRSKAPKEVVTEHENWVKKQLDPTTTKSKLVISRHPGEVASATMPDSNWQSCVNPNWADSSGKKGTGPAWKKIPNEVKQGTLIAMHLKHDAHPNAQGEYDAKDILGRTLIKKHKGAQFIELSYHREGRNYGKFPEVASKAVDEFTHKNYPIASLSATKDSTVYDDDFNSSKFNPNITSELVGKALLHKTPESKIAALKTNKVSKQQLHDVLSDINPDVRLTAIRNDNIDVDHITQALNDQTTAIRLNAIKNYNTTPEHITQALSDPDPEIRNVAIRKSNVTPEHLMTAASDQDLWVAKSVAYHPKANSKHIEKLLKHSNAAVRMAALENENITSANIEDALKDPDADVRLEAIKHKNVTDDQIKRALKDSDENVVGGALIHRSVSGKHLDDVINSNNVHLKLAAMKNPNITSDHISKLLQDSSKLIRREAVKHMTTPEHIAQALKDSDEYIREDSMLSKYVTPEHIDTALDDKNDDFRYRVINHKNASKANLEKALKDSNKYVMELAQERLDKKDYK